MLILYVLVLIVQSLVHVTVDVQEQDAVTVQKRRVLVAQIRAFLNVVHPVMIVVQITISVVTEDNPIVMENVTAKGIRIRNNV